MKQKQIGAVVAKAAGLGPRQIRAICSTESVDRVGDQMLMSGCDLKAYHRNPIVLLEHDRTKPIGTAKASVQNGRLVAEISFAPEGASECADEACRLAKSGVLSAVSIGFQPIEAEPIRGGGYRYKKFEVLEISLVAVPALPDAQVIQRNYNGARQSVFGNGSKADPRAKRLRDAERLALKHAADALSRAERDAEVRRLKTAREITPPSGDAVSFAHAKAAELHDEAMARSAKAYASAPASEAQRLGDLARLGR